MSADNYMYIEKGKKNKYTVWMCVASMTMESYEKGDLEGQKMYEIGSADTFEKAFKLAEEYDDDGMAVEYGITQRLWAK